MHGIKEYITAELENPAAALNTVANITKAMRNLVDFPDIGTRISHTVEVQADYRYLVSGNYLVFYRQEGDRVYVVRVLYGRRDYLKILFGCFQEKGL